MKSLRTLALAGTVLATLIPHGTAEANGDTIAQAEKEICGYAKDNPTYSGDDFTYNLLFDIKNYEGEKRSVKVRCRFFLDFALGGVEIQLAPTKSGKKGVFYWDRGLTIGGELGKVDRYDDFGILEWDSKDPERLKQEKSRLNKPWLSKRGRKETRKEWKTMLNTLFEHALRDYKTAWRKLPKKGREDFLHKLGFIGF